MPAVRYDSTELCHGSDRSEILDPQLLVMSRHGPYYIHMPKLDHGPIVLLCLPILLLRHRAQSRENTHSEYLRKAFKNENEKYTVV